ncbi:DNA-directed RNA polymerase subunit delta [Brockia lithotrophica]|uniref:RNAP delta factor n=1 Tax=Brockia lithotrophica TaxID=933949 RepID=A0A660KTC6_9BACL|nr:DNA-directed RNA polymerase subunit delta [Brockia lithotrophica]RKQ83867.1 DNA-directed RNA polymerase subunit delta [Brockia lithotrophica]
MGWEEEYVRETPMVELAYRLLVGLSQHEPMPFEEIAARVLAQKGYAPDDVARMAQLYTSLNVDGRFVHVGGGQWGLRDWYPFDKYEELIPTFEEEDELEEDLLEAEEEDLLPLGLDEEGGEVVLEDLEKDLLAEEPLDEELPLPEEEDGEFEGEEETP